MCWGTNVKLIHEEEKRDTKISGFYPFKPTCIIFDGMKEDYLPLLEGGLCLLSYIRLSP
jgi:hypothetical protein